MNYTQIQRTQAADILENFSPNDIEWFDQRGNFFPEGVYEAIETAIDVLREQGWVKTSEKVPTEEDANNDGEVHVAYDIGMNGRISISDYPAYFSNVADDPEYYVYWHRIEKLPPLPEVK